MSTIQRVQLDRQAHDACALVAQAQYQLLVVRERQLAEADRECNSFRDDCVRAEAMHDRLSDAIDAVCQRNHLGPHGTPPEMLVRIAGLIETYVQAHDSEQQEIGALKEKVAELEAALAGADSKGLCGAGKEDKRYVHK